jgi:monoamine oxidase
MLDVAIIGGGLCGLALAHSLAARRCNFRLFEARERLGGRILSVPTEPGAVLDLGPAWFWPETQPSITRLIADLGLPTLAQRDDGRVLHLTDPNQAPQTLTVTPEWRTAADASAEPGRLHGGAHRLVGGMQALVDAFVSALDRAGQIERLRTGHALEALHDHGDHIELRLRHGPVSYSVQARQVVLALPPRVAQSTVNFTPALSPELAAALQATPTWMASAAKAAIAFEQPFWHAQGHTGNAWINHAQAVLAEVFDACGPEVDGVASPAALAGFFALNAEQRQAFRSAMPLLLRSQFALLFGLEAEAGELHWHDWATEPWTCSPLDRAEDAQPPGHPHYGDPRLMQAQWGGRLWFGGSETAAQGGGYLEGALSAAARLRRSLTVPHGNDQLDLRNRA